MFGDFTKENQLIAKKRKPQERKFGWLVCFHGVMTEYSTFPNAPEVEPPHQII